MCLCVLVGEDRSGYCVGSRDLLYSDEDCSVAHKHGTIKRTGYRSLKQNAYWPNCTAVFVLKLNTTEHYNNSWEKVIENPDKLLDSGSRKCDILWHI